MKRIGLKGTCIGCGAPANAPDCECEWVSCSNCGYPDCWLNEEGDYRCRNCDYTTGKKEG